MTTQNLSFDPPLKHWRLETRKDLLLLTIDRQGTSTNSLNAEVLRELSTVITHLEQVGKLYHGLLLQSGKDSGFIMGADINTIRDTKSPEQLKLLVKEVHEYFNRFEALPFPKAALIDGFCLGGGMELALCCDYRIVTPSAKLGLPEVKLGLHPGFAGTARLMRLLPPTQALPLMIQGNTVSGRKAVNQGLADKVVNDAKELIIVGSKWVQQGRSLLRQSWRGKLMSLPPVRKFIAQKIEERVAQKVCQAHYPAPYAIIQLWREYGGCLKKMANAEIDSFVALRQTAQSDALIRLYFLQEHLKSAGKNDADRIQHVHIIGGGIMGGDIAAWTAMQGIYTTLNDVSQEQLEQAATRAYRLFDKKLRDVDTNRQAKMRLRLDKEGWGLEKADIVIEAIVENLEVKQKVFNNILSRAKPDAIIATNTSSLRLEDIAAALPQPERLIGIHFFNPVSQMPLVEVVHQQANTPETLHRAAKYIGQIKRLPLSVKSSPGFLVNRVLVPYLFEALKCHQEGIDNALIDKAAEDFGMPIGPIELADSVGLDVCQAIADTMREFIGEQPTEELEKLVETGHLGRKVGRGFYQYVDGKAQKQPVEAAESIIHEIQQRLILSYLNACAWCLREGVVEDMDLVDAGCVFGTGFAPFRGGPMHYANTVGYAKIIEELNRLSEQYGERFTPDIWWQMQYQTE